MAEHLSGSISNFSNLMNQKSKELGLTNTHFLTPHGLDEDGHYTTAYELAILSNYAMNNEIFAKIVGTKHHTISINGIPKTLTNTNELLGNLNGIYGIKTGFTNGANRCLVTCCKRGNMDIICVVLGADTKKYRTTDSIKLIEYSFNNFTNTNISEIISNEFNNWKQQNISTISIEKGIYSYIDISYNPPLYNFIPVRNDLINNFNTYITYISTLKAPIVKGHSIGSITLKIDETIIYSTNIYITSDIRRKNIFDYLKLFYKNLKFSY